MANEIVVPDTFGPVPSVFKDSPVDISRFTAGIGIGWPTLTIKGKTWGVRARGDHVEFTEPNQRAGGALMPVQFLDIVIVDASTRISKVYYKNAFIDGQRPPPDCWSADGIDPDPGASEPQAKKCRGCPHNVMGSKISPDGKVRGKACSDNKRVALVLLEDIKNEVGPIMLRLPPGSFSNYTGFVNTMAARGYPPFSYVTRLTFDPKAAHPRIAFQAVRVLTEQEAADVVTVQKNPVIGEMLNEKALGAILDPEVADEEFNNAPAELPKAAVAPAPTSPFAAARAAVAAAQPAQPTVTLDQKRIAELEAELAAAKAPAEPEPEPVQVKTPEQLRIEQLEKDLAEAKATKKVGRPRTKPVSPPASTAAAMPAPGPTPTPIEEAITRAGNGKDDPAVEAAKPSAVGNSISSRLASLVKAK